MPAKKAAREAGKAAVSEKLPPLPDFRRCPKGERAADRHKIKVTDIDEFLIDHEAVQLGGVEQLADREQTAALAYALLMLKERYFDGKRTLRAEGYRRAPLLPT